ncbi:MAG: zinc ribbon domain-containing protein [Candidatus Peribacteraceae bacterium]|jgi:putative FmdB family regulatory protein
MPTFDFRCRDCSATFEFERPFGSKAKPACPVCKSKKTEKMLTPPAIQFKGKGFYKTDSRPRPPTNAPASTPNGTKEKGKTEPAPKKTEPACGGDGAACPAVAS